MMDWDYERMRCWTQPEQPEACVDPDVRRKRLLAAGADYVYGCGCYWFSGNLIACREHSPFSRPVKEPSR